MDSQSVHSENTLLWPRLTKELRDLSDQRILLTENIKRARCSNVDTVIKRSQAFDKILLQLKRISGQSGINEALESLSSFQLEQAACMRRISSSQRTIEKLVSLISELKTHLESRRMYARQLSRSRQTAYSIDSVGIFFTRSEEYLEPEIDAADVAYLLNRRAGRKADDPDGVIPALPRIQESRLHFRTQRNGLHRFMNAISRILISRAFRRMKLACNLVTQRERFASFLVRSRIGLKRFWNDCARSDSKAVRVNVFMNHLRKLGYPGDPVELSKSLDPQRSGQIQFSSIRACLCPYRHRMLYTVLVAPVKCS